MAKPKGIRKKPALNGLASFPIYQLPVDKLPSKHQQKFSRKQIQVQTWIVKLSNSVAWKVAELVLLAVWDYHLSTSGDTMSLSSKATGHECAHVLKG